MGGSTGARPSAAAGGFEDAKGRRDSMRGRRKRSKVTWFPLTGGSYNIGEPAAIDTTWNIDHDLDIVSTDLQVLDVRPLVWDAPLEPDDGTTGSDERHQLVDFVGNEYSLRRVVGKYYCWMRSNTLNDTTPSGPSAFQVVAGIFVARADDESAAFGSDRPVGFRATNTASLYSPDTINTCREPWLWRRRWLLGNPSGAGSAELQNGLVSMPTSNTIYGAGIFDGPHVDVKVGRRIGNDDRLWLVTSVKAFPLGGDWTSTVAWTVSYSADLRVLGTLRRARGKSAF